MVVYYSIKQFNKGFTLIELIITLLIISILMSIAYPNYLQYVTKARRMDGQTALINLAICMEKYYSKKHTYKNASVGTNSTSDIQISSLSPEGWYVLSILSQTKNSYNLKATPQGSQATHDLSCQSLTFNNLGVKGITIGPMGSPKSNIKYCWGIF